MKKIKIIILAGSFASNFMNVNCYAINTVQISRHTTVSITPTDTQVNPLESVVRIHLPSNTRTIGQAIGFLLNNAGFSLAHQENLSDAVMSTFRKPLPIVDRSLGAFTIRQALSIRLPRYIFLWVYQWLNVSPK